MKILIAADMEGITGVVHSDHTISSHAEYGRFRMLMTQDVNAAIRGALAAGADEVIVSDGHGDERNILLEHLDPRAVLNSGAPRPFSMVEGVDSGVDGALFIGYHARVGTPNAILDHTWSSACVDGVWIVAADGQWQPIGEIGLNAAVCGHFGVPVLMISGDQSACAEATALLGPIETAVVKRAIGRTSAECLPPRTTAEMIEQAAARAVGRLFADELPKPFVLPSPITAVIEFIRSEMADAAMQLPGARRLEGKRVQYTAQEMPEAYRGFRALVSLARV
ncbi:MAG: D-aminopeptidase [Chloroflexi bacterium ADurb.Bin325]|nr:MAG: D-aminopeptidase [Chloroflexi bacterium ADurb.Bin325]